MSAAPHMPSTCVIVDDDPNFRRVVRMVLEDGGYEVVGEAGDGRSGLKAVHQLGPDALVLDVNLPDMTGFDVAEQVLRNGAAPAIVITSSNDRSNYAELALRSGAHSFVPKHELSPAALDEALR